MGTLRQLKNKMRLDKELRPMMVRSMLHEVLIDLDGNGIPDNVEFYADGEDMPIAAYFGQAVEARFMDLGERIFERVLAAELIADELIAAFEEFEARAEEEYNKLQQEENAQEAEATTEAETAEEG